MHLEVELELKYENHFYSSIMDECVVLHQIFWILGDKYNFSNIKEIKMF